MNFIISSIVTSSLALVFHRTLEIAKKTNFSISLLQIGAKLYHKLGNFLLPIRASVNTKLGQLRFITNSGSFILLQIGAAFYKLGQVLLQIGAAITNWGKLCYKLGQLLQIGAIITNCGVTVSTITESFAKVLFKVFLRKMFKVSII